MSVTVEEQPLVRLSDEERAFYVQPQDIPRIIRCLRTALETRPPSVTRNDVLAVTPTSEGRCNACGTSNSWETAITIKYRGLGGEEAYKPQISYCTTCATTLLDQLKMYLDNSAHELLGGAL